MNGKIRVIEEIKQAVGDEWPFEAAYERLLPEVDAFPEHELVTINIDVPTVVTSALGAWPEISALRGELVAKLLRAGDGARAHAVHGGFVAGWAAGNGR